MTDSRWQLLREWPPGYGGIERVAHEMATFWRAPVFSLDAQNLSRAAHQDGSDPLPVVYPRTRVHGLKLGRLIVPVPSWSLCRILRSPAPLHGHLPSPGVLLILLLARCCRPKRIVSAHWHAFLESGADRTFSLFLMYQRLALLVLPHLSEVVTTSPVLADELVKAGCSASKVRVLSCCLDQSFEREALGLPLKKDADIPLRVLFIGRLESYKRLDWLIAALATLKTPWRLDVVGDGPRRDDFECQAQGLPVHFQGRLNEAGKLRQLAAADVLVLPSDRSNEAFGIVQLEAMAAGVPTLAFSRHRSGMGWVGSLPGLSWSQTPGALPDALARLASDLDLRSLLRSQARDRYLRLFSRAVWMSQMRALSRF